MMALTDEDNEVLYGLINLFAKQVKQHHINSWSLTFRMLVNISSQK